MRSLTVIWLHASREDDARHLPVVEHGMSDAFRDFCAEAFNVRMPLEYPPLKLTTVPSADALPDALFIDGDPSRGMTEGGDDDSLPRDSRHGRGAFRRPLPRLPPQPRSDRVPRASSRRRRSWRRFAGQPVVLPRDAAHCDGEFVTLESSVGRIASQFIVPYPPGIPVFVPGLRITEAMVSLVKGVIETEGVAAVHGLFCRGGHAPYYVEVLNRDEGKHLECGIATV